MKKVICIDDSNGRKRNEPLGLKVGETYHVTDERKDPSTGILHYQLQEKTPFDYYGAFRFAFTSDICETELAKQREELQTV